MIEKKAVLRAIRKAHIAWCAAFCSVAVGGGTVIGALYVFDPTGLAPILALVVWIAASLVSAGGSSFLLSRKLLSIGAEVCFLPFRAERLQQAYHSVQPTLRCYRYRDYGRLKVGAFILRQSFCGSRWRLFISDEAWRSRFSSRYFEALVAHELAHLVLPRSRFLRGEASLLHYFEETQMRYLFPVATVLMLSVAWPHYFSLIFAPILFPILLCFRGVFMWACRTDEFAADAVGAWYVDSKEDLGDFFRAYLLESELQRDRCWVGRFVRAIFDRWNATHPSIERRIAALDRL